MTTRQPPAAGQDRPATPRSTSDPGTGAATPADAPQDPADVAERQAIRAEIDKIDKRFSTLRARAALGGYQLDAVRGENGAAAYLIGKWGRLAVLPDLDAVAAFLDRALGAPKA